MNDLDAHARALIDANLYVTLGTVDGDGTPWVSPVYFATADYAEFYWMSADDAAHSRNIAGRRPSNCPAATSTVAWVSTRDRRAETQRVSSWPM